MRHIILVAILSGILIGVNAQSVLDSLEVDDINRFYRVYVPEIAKDQDNVPLVFNLHGRGSDASQQEFYAVMNEVADTAGFIICYPESERFDDVKLWNSGFDPNWVDDVGFINALIDEIHKDYAINLNKVYSCGMSNGGYQSLFMACELTNRFAAVASVTGSMLKTVVDNCEPNRAIPVMQIHGTDDPTVLYNGSDFGISIEELVQFWVAHNECNPIGDTLNIENIDTTDNTTAERIAYAGGTNNSEVIFYKVIDGEHTWPGSLKGIGTLLGRVNHDFNASGVIWNFFNQFALSDNISSHNEPFTLLEESIEIQPNPFNQFIVLSEVRPFHEIQIHHLNGQLLYQAFLSNNENKLTIDLSDLKSGMYLLQLISSDQVYFHKIIKNK